MDSFNLFKRYALVAAVCFPVILGGCAYFSPSAKQNRAEIKVEKTKEAIFTSEEEILKEGKAFVYAIDYSLKLSPDTNKYTEIAREMSSRAVETLSPIEKADIIKMRAIVDGLASTNKQILARAQSMLEEKDSEIVVLQNQISDYKQILKKSEENFLHVSRINSQLADTWKKITNGFWWIVWIVAIGFILNILSQLLPPPYSNLASIIGIPVGIFIKCIRGIVPAASKYAGIVSEKIHQESQNTTEKLVLAIEELKNKDRASYEKLKPILADKTDIEARNKILEVKKDYNLI